MFGILIQKIKLVKKLLICFVSVVIFAAIGVSAVQANSEPDYLGIKLKTVLFDKDTGVYKFEGNVREIKDKMNIKSFIKFSNNFEPLKSDGNEFKKIDIMQDNSYISYFKTKTKTGYLRETIAACYNKSILIYTKSNDTKRRWIKQELKRDCSVNAARF